LAVGSAESSEPKPVARPMTSTPTAMTAARTIFERLDGRHCGDLRVAGAAP
jgi:hypothetical protein